MEELAALLDRERVVLELVVFKLVELRQMLVSGEARFLGWAAEELDRALGQMRRLELERAVLVDGLAAERGLPEDGLTLRILIEDAPEPWRTTLDTSRRALQLGSTEAADLLQAVRRLAASGAGSLADTLASFGGAAAPQQPTTTYGPSASWTPSAPRPRYEHSL